MKLSDHFTLEEFTYSEVAARLDLVNVPGPAELTNLRLTAALMEQVRTLLGHPVVVHSGYRAPRVNQAVGGVPTSKHCQGLACDFVCPEFGSIAQVAIAIEKSEIKYDQLILEYGWVHLGLADAATAWRRQSLTKRSARAPYESGIKV